MLFVASHVFGAARIIYPSIVVGGSAESSNVGDEVGAMIERLLICELLEL